MRKRKKCLYLCNTVYQVLVALWIDYHINGNSQTTFLISDHMNGGKTIADRMNLLGINSFFIETHDYCYDAEYKRKLDNSIESKRMAGIFPEIILNQIVHIPFDYETIYIANIDNFSKLLVNALGHRFRKPKIVLFEDGLSTYTKTMESFYLNSKLHEIRSLKEMLAQIFIYRKYTIWGHIKFALVFQPELMMWNPKENLKLDTIDCSDSCFLNAVNNVFNYNPKEDEYDKKYIFFEESFFADKIEVYDTVIVEAIAKRVGKENLIVKIHPRNPENRFKKLGYRTNVNTGIPWEVICMNKKDISDHVFLSIGSGSVINPKRLFNTNAKVYSLYNMLDLISKQHINRNIWEITEKVIKFYPNEMKVIESIEEIS